MHKHEKALIPVTDPFIEKFAKKYIEQRSETVFRYEDLESSSFFAKTGFKTDEIEALIKKSSVARDFEREKGKTPMVLRDIYRSDLGELLMTYFFEEKVPEGERFIIPLKNITSRERADMPGRGLDAIGYRVDGEKILFLIGEAKVSHEKRSPPGVVHDSDDSIYKTQKAHKDDLKIVIQKLSDHSRKLGCQHAQYIAAGILAIEKGLADSFDIRFGCCLLRDHTCVNEDTDYGKLKSNCDEFDPYAVHFALMAFTEKSIEETVDLFYNKVQSLVA
jgi:hypothetical protein